MHTPSVEHEPVDIDSIVDPIERLRARVHDPRLIACMRKEVARMHALAKELEAKQAILKRAIETNDPALAKQAYFDGIF